MRTLKRRLRCILDDSRGDIMHRFAMEGPRQANKENAVQKV
jgi:hypothetical protein